MVGGSTRIPKVHSLLKKEFDKAPSHGINADEAIAHGAAIHAAVAGGMVDCDEGPVLESVTSLSMGLETDGGKMSIVIPKASHMPIRRQVEVATDHEDQTAVTLKVWEGERPLARDNHFLGSFRLTGLNPDSYRLGGKTQGKEIKRAKVLVTFRIDGSGILSVTAEEVFAAGGAAGSLTVQEENTKLTAEQIAEMIQKADAAKEADLSKVQKVTAEQNLKNSILYVRTSSHDEKLTVADKQALLKAANDTAEWLEANGNAAPSLLMEKQAALEKHWAVEKLKQTKAAIEAELPAPTMDDDDDDDDGLC